MVKMFSKALFKQSCKANGTMWAVITAAVCFMLACVMLISGSGNIGAVRNSIQDTIIVKEIDAQFEERAIGYYTNADDGLREFDSLFTANATDTLSCLLWASKMPSPDDYVDSATYAAATEAWRSAMPTPSTDVGEAYGKTMNDWLSEIPSAADYKDEKDYATAFAAWSEASPATEEEAVTAAYTGACDEIQKYMSQKAFEAGYASDTAEAKEIFGSVMYSLNPAGSFNDFYTSHGEEAPTDYDYMSLIESINNGTASEYIVSAERDRYRNERAQNGTAIFLAGNMTTDEAVQAMVNALSAYGVTEEKFTSFDYTYDAVKHMAITASVTYQSRLDYELELLEKDCADEEEYISAVKAKKEDLATDISASFLSTLPSAVSEALEEIGQADLYTLIVGSVFYKLAGLLLPIIYMIMACNNLIAGQVDSGSMAYVLSTSTKRITVVFTQALYMIGSLLAMFSLTTATGCVCLNFVTEDVKLTYGKLVMLNVGAFLVLLALSGLCFFTSCWFDRSKHSMAIGGGLSIFALVAAMLGLFGSPVIPSVVRLEALNNFNYVTAISLFDVISIIDGTNAFVWKFVILGIAGIVGYIAGALKFTKKDLPL